jgi:hypothetical protein
LAFFASFVRIRARLNGQTLAALMGFSAALVCPVASADRETVTVLAGTEARLALVDRMSSQTAITGQKFKLALDQDIRLDGRVVIPRGTEAVGTVLRVGRRGMVGTAGLLSLRVDCLLVDGRRIPLLANLSMRGGTHEFAAIFMTALFGPVGIFRRGGEVVVPAGSLVLAYIDANAEISVPTLLSPPGSVLGTEISGAAASSPSARE